MAIAFVQGVSASGSSGVSPQALPAFGSSIAAKDLIVVLAGGDGGATGLATSVSDSLGNTYTRVPLFDIANAGGTLNLDCFYAVVATGHTGASNVISLTFNSTLENCVVVAQHFNGFTGTATFDKKSTSSNASSTTITSGATGTLATAVELVVGLGIHDSTVSAITLGAGYTNLTEVSIAAREAAMESKVVAATTAVTATFSIAAARVNIGGVVTFRDVASGTAWTSSLSGTYSTSGTMTTRAVVKLLPLATYSASGTLNPRRLTRNLTGLYKSLGSLAKNTIMLPLTGTYSTSGLLSNVHGHGITLTGIYSASGLIISRNITRPLTGLYKATGALTLRAITRALSGSYKTSGLLTNRAVTRPFTATYSAAGSLASSLAHSLHFKSLSATYSTSGSLTRKTTRSFTATYKTSGFFVGFIKPIFNYISVIVGSLAQSGSVRENTSAKIPSSDTISTIADTGTSKKATGETDSKVINDSNQNTTLKG